MTIRVASVLGVAVALLVAGCGDGEDGGGGTPAPTTTAAAPSTTAPAPATTGSGESTSVPAPSAVLTIRVWPEGRTGPAQEYALMCDPDGGTLPDPGLACEAVRSVGFLFDDPPTDRACTEQYGGPAVAEVDGQVRGEPVHAVFDRTNGCDIARWDRAEPLLPLPDGPPPD